MLINIAAALTADAATAHQINLGGPLLQSQTSNFPSTPSCSFPLTAILSLPGLVTLYNKYKDMEPPPSQGGLLRDMTRSPVESAFSSDGEGSNADTSFQASSRIGRSQSVRKPSSRPKTFYQLAHPAAHACHRHLKIRPKLLLQLQRVSQTPRPLPVFDVLPSSVFLPRLARKFPTIFRGKNGLGPNDLIIVISDLYEQTLADSRDSRSIGTLDGDDDDAHQDVVATICQLLNEEALSKGKAEICLNHGPAWEATPLSNGSYEFVAHTAQGIQTVRWVRRGVKNRRTSAPPGFPVQQAEESKRFTFSVINANTRRHPVIAAMTRNHLEVNEEYTMPTASPSSLPTSTMSMLSEAYETEASSERNVIKLDDDLRLLVIVTSIWVAFREGWSHSFRYNDAALRLNGKTMSSPVASRHPSPTTTKHGPDYFSDEKNYAPESGPSGGRKHRMSMSSMPSSSDRFKALASGKLARRSNSTGAAFIERSNRRSASGNKGRTQRYSVRSTDENSRDAAFIPETIQQGPADGHAQAFNRGSGTDGTVKFTATAPEPTTRPNAGFRRTMRQPAAPSTSRGLSEKTQPLAPAKPKRRHRISEFFDCIFRRSGNH